MMTHGLPALINWKTANCEAPAKTMNDMPTASKGDNPTLTAATPEIIANGTTPSKIGTAARAPA
jgi:hypothetical protein